VYFLRPNRLGAACPILFQAPLRLLCPKALGLLLAQLLQASQEPFRQGRTIMDLQAQGVSENLGRSGILTSTSILLPSTQGTWGLLAGPAAEPRSAVLSRRRRDCGRLEIVTPPDPSLFVGSGGRQHVAIASGGAIFTFALPG